MMIYVKPLLLIALIRVLRASDSPGLCAGVYGFFLITTQLAFLTIPLSQLLTESALAIAVSWVWFWLLERFDHGLSWWITFILGSGLLFI